MDNTRGVRTSAKRPLDMALSVVRRSIEFPPYHDRVRWTYHPSVVIHKGVDDGRFSRLKMLADGRLFDVQGLGNGALRAASRAVVVAHLDRLVQHRSLFFGEQFEKVSVVSGLWPQFQFVAAVQQRGDALTCGTERLGCASNGDDEPFLCQVGGRDPPHVLKGGKDTREGPFGEGLHKRSCLALFNDAQNFQ